jgi:2-polyprenyl-6-methoxyphenol hydroxylase-like FAD-dependent oxidoreductase
MISADVIVVGAGLAGCCAAETLGRRGFSVILVDPQADCPPLFRAEKLEPDQVQLLRKLGLFERLLPLARRIRAIGVGYNGRLFESMPIEQYGICYRDLVNALRTRCPAVERKLGRVERIANSAQLQYVVLQDGQELTARLVLLSCGTSSELQARVGLRKEMIRKEQSLSFGFCIARPDGAPFPFDAVTYHPTTCAERIDYLSLFVMGDAMRANLFAFRSLDDPWVRQFITDPSHELRRVFPKLARVIGEFRVISRVDTSRVDLYRMRGEVQPGVVLIGDAFQNACPSTGIGVSKVLTDVDVLCSDYVPRWLATPGMGCEKVAAFYEDPRKRSIDASALEKAEYRRRASTDASLRWRMHRLRLHVAMQFRGPFAPKTVRPAFSFGSGRLRRAQ